MGLFDTIRKFCILKSVREKEADTEKEADKKE